MKIFKQKTISISAASLKKSRLIPTIILSSLVNTSPVRAEKLAPPPVFSLGNIKKVDISSGRVKEECEQKKNELKSLIASKETFKTRAEEDIREIEEPLSQKEKSLAELLSKQNLTDKEKQEIMRIQKELLDDKKSSEPILAVLKSQLSRLTQEIQTLKAEQNSVCN